MTVDQLILSASKVFIAGCAFLMFFWGGYAWAIGNSGFLGFAAFMAVLACAGFYKFILLEWR